MFTSNKKQYINILQQNKQLKLDFKIIQENKIVTEEQAYFFKTDSLIPSDAELKINALQKSIRHTIISSLYESPNQYIIPTKEVDSTRFDSIKLGNNNSVVIPKNEIDVASKYYEKTGIDYILSPYTIIEEYLEDNAKNNSLNFLIYNNIIYAIIFNNKKELTYNKIKSLTPFESTQDETFFEDDIVGQKLYEEVSFLEIQDFINDTIEDYYTKNSDVEFLEHIEILYTLRPLSEEQIVLLEKSLMIPVTYKSISIDKYMDEIIQRSNSAVHNFITPRTIKEDKSLFVWLGLSVLTIVIVIVIFTMKLEDKSSEVNEIVEVSVPLKKPNEIEVEKKEQVADLSVLVLPTHSDINTQIVQNIQMLFDVLPYDAILKDIEINEDNSTFVANFLKTSTSLVDMQMKLKNFYKDSKILLENKNKVMSNIIIQNTELLITQKIAGQSEYKKYNFLSTSKATAYLKGLALENSIITFDGKKNVEHLIYYFTVISTVKSPEEFFAFVKILNKQKLAVELAYPIVFSSKTDEIEVKYQIKMYQQNKEQVSLKK